MENLNKKIAHKPKKRAPKLRKTSWSWPRILFWALALCTWTFLSLVISSFLISRILYIFLDATTLATPLWTTIYNTLSYVGALLLTVLVPWKIFRRAKPTREQLGLKGLPSWVDLGLAPVGFLVYLLAAAALTALFQLSPWFDAAEAQNVGYSTLLGSADLIIAFIALVIVAPITEELIFRGWLYGKLRTRLNMPIAILLVSLLFALLHGQWNVGVNVFALSLVLCALREITGTIYSGIILHMLKNAIAFYLVYVII